MQSPNTTSAVAFTKHTPLKLDWCTPELFSSIYYYGLSWYKSLVEFEFWQFHQVVCFCLSYLFIAIYRNTLDSNSTICHQFRSNSVPVNERDGGGNVSITAGLVLNELCMYLLSVVVCSTKHVCCCSLNARLLEGQNETE